MKTAAAKKPAGRETHYEAMVRLGLIGCIKGGPSDVARNRRKYLRRALCAKNEPRCHLAEEYRRERS